MNKLVTIIIISLVSIIAKAQTKADFSSILNIKYTSGDESYHTEEMAFEIRNDKVYGKITNPNTDELLSSEYILKDEEIEILNSFLKLVEKYKNGCHEEYRSSNVQYYSIIKDNQTIEIRKFCDWEDFPYLTIKQIIFGQYLKNLEKKKQELNDEMFILLKGNWKESVQLDKLDLESICTLEKIDINPSLNEYIEFNEKQKLILHRNGKKVYYEYRIDIYGEDEYLNMFGDRDKNGDEPTFGHSFLIISLDKNEIKLTRG